MQSKSFLFVLLILLPGTLQAHQAASIEPGTATAKLCAQAEARPVTPPVLHGPLTDTQLTGCNERSLYYGLSGKPDFPAALQCGWYQYAHPQTTQGNMFYGPGVLAMLYANGDGVTRDYDMALRFACENPWAAPAELEGRITHLEAMKAGRSPGHFDLCDDATSGLSEGACEAITAGKQTTGREAKISALSSQLPPSAQAQFSGLQAAERAFELARSANEVDLSGTGRAAFQIAEEQKLSDQFLINLQRFGRKDIPAATTQDLASLDAQLNNVFQQLMHTPAGAWQGSTITPDGIRTTQRTWLKLVDTWTAFANSAYPSLSSESVRAQLIRLRLHQLRSLEPQP